MMKCDVINEQMAVLGVRLCYAVMVVNTPLHMEPDVEV